MVPIPTVKRWGDVHGPIDEHRVKRDREGEEAKRNISQRKGERQRIEGARSKPGQDERRDEQTVVVDQRKERADDRKRGRSDE